MKLTVAIPSYNGEEHIVGCINSVLESLKNCPAKNEVLIEVFINGSTDRTLEVLKNEYGNLLEVNVTNFSSNLGFDRNILRLLRSIKSEYVWLIGDDDIIHPAALDEIHRRLLQYHPTTIILDATMFFDEPHSSEVPVGEEITTSVGDFFGALSWRGSALSSNIWYVPGLNLEKSEDYVGTNWIHVNLMIDLSINQISPDKPCLYLSGTLLYVRTGNPRWETNFGDWYLTGVTHIESLKKILKNQPKNIFQRYIDSRYSTNMRDLVLSGHRDNLIERTRLSYRLMKLFYRKPRFWYIDLPYVISSANLRKVIEYLYMAKKKSKFGF